MGRCINADEIAKKIFSPKQYEDYCSQREMQLHFLDCVATKTPSERCTLTDPTENLKWCAYKVEMLDRYLENYYQDILVYEDRERYRELQAKSGPLIKEEEAEFKKLDGYLNVDWL
jgi:hypothetical protein